MHDTSIQTPAERWSYYRRTRDGDFGKSVSTQRVKEILQQQGKTSQRERELPAHLMVYYVMGLGMWMEASCREVLRCLLMGVHWLLGSEQRYKVTGKSGITQARQRFGMGSDEDHSR
jgi:hypothetical protein